MRGRAARQSSPDRHFLDNLTARLLDPGTPLKAEQETPFTGIVATIGVVNAARLLLSTITGLSTALLSFAVFYVRGDAGGVMMFLRERGKFRKLVTSGASPEQIDAARAHVQHTAERLAAPDLATRLIPLELLIGVLAACAIWWAFGRRAARMDAGRERPDVQERMVVRFAHRHGGHFTLHDLSDKSPLNAEQARVTVNTMLERGQLRREGEGYALP